MKLLKNRKSYILLSLLSLITVIQFTIFGFSTGTILVGALTIATGLHIFIKFLNKRYDHKALRYLQYLFRFGLILIGSLSIILLFLISQSTKSCEIVGSKAKNADHMIILGAGLNGDQVSKRLQLRLDKGLEAFESNPELQIIVSGGQGSDEIISEARAMANYLIKNGIPEEKITLEDKSRSTVENLLFSKEKISKDSKGVLIISSDFHIFRSKLIANKLGLNAELACNPSELHIKTNYMIREVPAVICTHLLLIFIN